jgi:DNA polymerase-3 subunit delta'
LLQPIETDFLKNGLLTGYDAHLGQRGNAAAIQDLIQWSEQIAVLVEKAKRIFYSFASKCSDKPCCNYQTPSLVYIKLEKFNRDFAPL